MNTADSRVRHQNASGKAWEAKEYSLHSLERESGAFEGTAGVSAANGKQGFVPAFLDTHTGEVYLSRFRDGRPAPMHLLDGLPAELIVRRSSGGRVAAVKGTVAAGFIQQGRFYTREEAARALGGRECAL